MWNMSSCYTHSTFTFMARAQTLSDAHKTACNSWQCYAIFRFWALSAFFRFNGLHRNWFWGVNSSEGDKMRSVFYISLLHNFPTEQNKVGKKTPEGIWKCKIRVEILRFLHAFDDEFGTVTSSWLLLKTPGVKGSSGWSGEIMTEGL